MAHSRPIGNATNRSAAKRMLKAGFTPRQVVSFYEDPYGEADYSALIKIGGFTKRQAAVIAGSWDMATLMRIGGLTRSQAEFIVNL